MGTKAVKPKPRKIHIALPEEVYVGAIEAKDVLDISYADVRRIHERDIERYVGIQRELSSDRVDELKQYVKAIDAAFPTSIILAVDSDNAVYDGKTGIMEITRNENVAKMELPPIHWTKSDPS